MNICVHIERLILDDVPVASHQRELVKAAVEAELARLIASQGLTSSRMAGGAEPSLSGGGLQLERDATPSGVGAQIAQVVHRSLNT